MTDTVVVEEISEETRESIISEIFSCFFPKEEKRDDTISKRFGEAKVLMRDRILSLVKAGKYSSAKILMYAYERVFEFGIIGEYGNGNARVTLKYEATKGYILVERADGRKDIIMNGTHAAQLLRDLFTKAREIVDEDDFLFI